MFLWVAALLPLSVVPAAEADNSPFGIASFTSHTTDELGADYTTAGGHPFLNDTRFDFPTYVAPEPQTGDKRYPVEALKDAGVTLAPGFFGNPAAAPRCPIGGVRDPELEPDQSPSTCPPGSQVGFAHIALLGQRSAAKVVPIFNLVPELGYPAQFGSVAENVVVILSVTPLPRSESYGLTIASNNTKSLAQVWSFEPTICGYGAQGSFPGFSCKPPSKSIGAPFLSNPLDCSNTQPSWKIAADSWEHAATYLPSGLPDLANPGWKTASVLAPPVNGCDDPALADLFVPSLATKPLQPGGGAVQADQPTGLAVDLDFPQSNDPTDPETEFDPKSPQAPEPKDITVKLPAGLSISPSSAEGLGACSDDAADPAGDQVHYDSTKPVSCPDASKIGSAVATSPLLALRDPVDEHVVGAEPIPGDVFLLKPHPGDLPIGGGNQGGKFRILIQLENPGAGINFKLPGIATADPQTGQLTATFPDNPQLPASHITVNLKEGPRAPLASPTGCGTFTSSSTIVPWSAPETPDAHPSAAFGVNSGPNGTGCPLSPANRPFSPSMRAGTESSAAGQASPFDLRLSRQDGEQELGSLDFTAPRGFTASLKSVSYCTEAAIAAARTTTAAGEKNSPSCPDSSKVGNITVGAGAGATPFYVTGNVYLAGPYEGAPLSLVFVTPVEAGPFDLGTAVVLAALEVNPETARITARTDALPLILDGVPLRLRSIDLDLDRPQFTINPTNCEPMSVSAAIPDASGATATPSSLFQADGCAGLGFQPKLTLKLLGSTKRSAHPALRVGLFARPGDANIRSAALNLPRTELLESSHFRHVCNQLQFDAGSCPSASVYGRAEARIPLLDQPLTGPVYLRANPASGLPDLVASLDGQIHLDVVAHIDSTPGRIRTTFDTPDIPISSFRVNLFGGSRGLVVNSGGVCGAPRGRVELGAQNGKVFTSRPKLQAACAKGGHKGKRGRR